MKYDVKFSCGHNETIQLFGKYADPQNKIKWFEECGICSSCYKEQKRIEYSNGCKEVEMKYADYKKNYPNCKRKAGNYNSIEKTIIVYVPENERK